MNLSTSFNTCVFQKYADFKGKASRSEYWWFWVTYSFGILGLPLLSFILSDAFDISCYPLMFLWLIVICGLTCPFIAVSIRRLHDAGFSGWHFLWRIIPYIGSVITCVLMCHKSVNISSDTHMRQAEQQTSINHGTLPTEPNHKIKENKPNRFQKLKRFGKKLSLSLLVTACCGIGLYSCWYIPIFILLFVYYQYLIWRQKKTKTYDVLLLPLLRRIGLFGNIQNDYILKKKLLTFAAILTGTIFIAYCTAALIDNNYEGRYDGTIITLFTIDLLAWIIFFFYEYGTLWLSKNNSTSHD